MESSLSILTKKGQELGFFSTLESMFRLKALPFSCGRAAMVKGLEALGFSRMDEILVPPFLCQAVLSALSLASFPTMMPTHRTKGILVLHQFGYPQQLDVIEKQANTNGWKILSDCAHTIFSTYKDRHLSGWGDFSILSLSKIYPCILGGAFVSSKRDIFTRVMKNYNAIGVSHLAQADRAYEVLNKANNNLLCEEAEFEVAAVYGYLPKVVAFPSKAIASLPQSREKIEEDIKRRKELLNIVRSYFANRIPRCPESDIVPYAIPILFDPSKLWSIRSAIKKKIGIDIPVLHFDFARNMLKPNYKKTLIIECRYGMNSSTVIKICELLK